MFESLTSTQLIAFSVPFVILTLLTLWLLLRVNQNNIENRVKEKRCQELEERLIQLQKQSQIQQEQLSRQQARLGALEATERLLQSQRQQLQEEHSLLIRQERRLQQELSDLLRERDTLSERFANQTQALEEKQKLLESSEQRLTKEFESLANRIFEQKSQAIRSSNESSLETLLKPFKEQILGFQEQVQKKNEADHTRHSLLQKELDSLKQLNLRMSEEALNLTRALKGENKTQGNWGEIILQRLLDQAGLTEGREYETQLSLNSEQGKRQQPDVVVHLPQEKDIIIDSKVTLTAYERYTNAESEAEKKQALQAHVLSLKTHIKELGKKNYQELKALKTLDYVLLFVPVESAFICAVQEEPELIRLALDHNILLVSPTNLMVALRTIHNIWQVEQQNRNAQEIADRAGKLYDKFVGFVDDLDKMGQAIGRASKEYEAARNKLESGQGNLIRQATMLQELGIRSTKKLPETLLD